MRRLFAEVVCAAAADGRFVRVAARPDWVDQSEMLDCIDPASNRFEPEWLALALRSCRREPDRTQFVLVDEKARALSERVLGCSKVMPAVGRHVR